MTRLLSFDDIQGLAKTAAAKKIERRRQKFEEDENAKKTDNGKETNSWFKTEKGKSVDTESDENGKEKGFHLNDLKWVDTKEVDENGNKIDRFEDFRTSTGE